MVAPRHAPGPRDPAGGPEVLRGTGLAKSYGGHLVLKRINFAIEAGEIVAVIGENGAGKSTFAKIVAGAVRPESGELHLSGRRDAPWLEEIKGGLPDNLRPRYHLYDYMHTELPWAMAAADLALCRSGASVMGELPAAGLPAILVPYPYAGGHQRLNARYMERNRAAVVLDDRDLGSMLPVAGALLHDGARLDAMRHATRALARPEAASSIARILIELANGAAA